jgi:hypothetical protein
VLWFLRWLVVLLLTYEWLGFVLSRFPYTRPWGESLNNYLLEVATYLFQSIISAIPGLGVALMIFFIARGVSAFSKRVLRRMAGPGILNWLNEGNPAADHPADVPGDLAVCVAMAIRTCRGGTDAFKGLSVLIGLMISWAPPVWLARRRRG